MNLAIAPIDLGIVILFLIFSVAFGIWVGRRSRDLSGYLLGGRQQPWWLLLGSIVATETSTVTFLSIPGTVVAAGGNLQFLQLVAGFMLGRLIVVGVFLPRYFRGDLFTAYQVLRERFGGTTSSLASGLFVVTRTLADGLRLYLTAVVLEKAFSLGFETSVLVLGTATIIYTFFGGMKSVIWNDCIQLTIYLVGAALALAILVQQLGFETYVEFGLEQQKFAWLNLDWDLAQPYTLWAGLLGGAFLSLATHGTDQLMVQRYLSSRRLRDAAWAVALSGPVVFLQFALFLLLGVGLAAFYSSTGGAARNFAKGDEIFATFIVEELPVGLTGLVLAAVFAAAMSTLSSSLSSSAAAVVNDLWLPWQRPPQPPSSSTHLEAAVSPPPKPASASARPDAGPASSDAKWTWRSRLLTLVFGLLQMGVAWSADRLLLGGEGGLADSVIAGVLAIAGFVTGIVLGIFGLGLLPLKITDRTAAAAMLIGFAAMTLIAFFSPLAWTWFSLTGALLTVGAGILLQTARTGLRWIRSGESGRP